MRFAAVLYRILAGLSTEDLLSGNKFRRQVPVIGQIGRALQPGADGKLLRASVKKSGGNGFDEAALEAVRKAKFRPAMHNGRPTACIVLLPIHFTLRNAS